MASPPSSTRWAYLNGDWIDDRTLSLPVGDLGFLQGVTVTERLRTFAGKPFRQTEHLERMRRSCETIGLDAGQIVPEIDAAIEELIGRNNPLLNDGEEWSVVAFATPGAGVTPTRCVHFLPLRMEAWAEQYERGVSLHVSDYRQTPGSCWPTDLKCRSRMHYYLADRQAEQIEPGSRALLLDQNGHVGETSIANVVIYNDTEGVISPRIERILPGVSLAVVRELAASLGLPFNNRDLTIENLASADEVWLTGTSPCLLPAVRCNHQPIGNGKPGPAYQRFLTTWSKLVGIDIAEQAKQRSTEVRKRP